MKEELPWGEFCLEGAMSLSQIRLRNWRLGLLVRSLSIFIILFFFLVLKKALNW